jgi:hypothetical protein
MPMATKAITARPPITPPTMAPTCVGEGVDVGLGIVGLGLGVVVVVELVVVVVELVVDVVEREVDPELDLAWYLEEQASL